MKRYNFRFMKWDESIQVRGFVETNDDNKALELSNSYLTNIDKSKSTLNIYTDYNKKTGVWERHVFNIVTG